MSEPENGRMIFFAASQDCISQRKRLPFKFKCNNVALKYEHRVNAVLLPDLAKNRIQRYFPFCKEGFFHGIEKQRIYYKKGIKK